MAGLGHLHAGPEGRRRLRQRRAARGASTATTVAVRDGDRVVTDGPFAETKEWLGGFYVIEAPDLDVALDHASGMPNISYGHVEVRPLMQVPAM